MVTIISGNKGLDALREKRVKQQSTDVTVGWTWYNESEGVVSWNFKNNSTSQKTVVLYRSGYYFGNAFFPIYVNNGMTSWATAPLTPLVDNGVANNTMPIGILDFGNGNRIIAFLFTLAPGQTWNELEGGFSSTSPPTDAMVFEVSLEKAGSFCIGYNQEQVIAWDTQTQSLMTGYTPNPNNITTVEMLMPTGSQYVSLFADPISDQPCPKSPDCIQELENSVSSANIEEFIKAIICYLNSGMASKAEFIEKFIEMMVKEKLGSEKKRLDSKEEKTVYCPVYVPVYPQYYPCIPYKTIITTTSSPNSCDPNYYE